MFSTFERTGTATSPAAGLGALVRTFVGVLPAAPPPLPMMPFFSFPGGSGLVVGLEKADSSRPAVNIRPPRVSIPVPAWTHMLRTWLYRIECRSTKSNSPSPNASIRVGTAKPTANTTKPMANRNAPNAREICETKETEAHHDTNKASTLHFSSVIYSHVYHVHILHVYMVYMLNTKGIISSWLCFNGNYFSFDARLRIMKSNISLC